MSDTYTVCNKCGEGLRVEAARPGQPVKRIHPSTGTDDCPKKSAG